MSRSTRSAGSKTMEQLMKRTFTIAIAIAVGAVASLAEGVMLNPRGTGEVLLYPYYTVNHQQTLVSVVNAAAHAKALKVRFREGWDGRSVADFDLYLGPHDTWVGPCSTSCRTASRRRARRRNLPAPRCRRRFRNS